MNSSGLPHSFPMPVPIQESYYNNSNSSQFSPGYPPQSGIPSVKWSPNGAWTGPMIPQGINDSWSSMSGMSSMNRPRPKLTTTLWEDENTVCFQVDAKGICVARRQDNDMVNGTKLLNVTGMSRGKRDGILKNEKGRVVVKVGAMHLKGVWITMSRAKALAAQFKISDLLFPLLVEDPSPYLYSPHYPSALPSRIGGLPAQSNLYMTSFADPAAASVRSQPQQHFMAPHTRMGYGSPVVPMNDTHNVGVLPQSSQNQFSIPYRYPGGNPHSHSPSMTHSSQGIEPYLMSDVSRIHSRSPLSQGGINHPEGTAPGDVPTQPSINGASNPHQATGYGAETSFNRIQSYNVQSTPKVMGHQLVPSSMIGKRREHPEDGDAESSNDNQTLPEPPHPHSETMFGPLGGRGYSFPSPCSLPSPSMSQTQQDLPPVNKRTKVLRYDSNPNTGYINPHHQQTKPIDTLRMPTPVGQESVGLIFGTFSPPESESEGGFTDTKLGSVRDYDEPVAMPHNNDISRFGYTNSPKLIYS
ncbi:hypothetical protein K493DRAFT_313896 [Basidiobolus meristosporus CBS 931.73]|uniref:HTH APSES-type domain-containing protein n=1 Tax=Basidiobolus meristosporus CBS 931.73 TaxID=1314790 RepID=A0A1Y1YJF3_9FUNG|nr:hypothetical protein K493DRAFT_313896 [Basidiobolus meristosporus CBS 931.73]|eukprot:ORX97886.1 hypothetical protein K493DRAFT_313896 [Basidiobolus meristosporus CBS 931.73]